jgi:uncharacterized protein with HEPN domain
MSRDANGSERYRPSRRRRGYFAVNAQIHWAVIEKNFPQLTTAIRELLASI